MSLPVVRFVHASDLHLERPPYGLTQLPEHLRDLFLEAPYWGAERVFEATVAERADFLLLAGDVLDVEASGPRGPLFLLEQFERLREHGIGVYWSAGGVDPPERWPSGFKLPDNVRTFGKAEVERATHHRGGQIIAEILGLRRPHSGRLVAEMFASQRNGVFRIALAHANATGEHWVDHGIDYWALGGKHRRQTLITSPCHVHYPGTPQGRSPSDTGSRGATLVEVEAPRTVRLRSVATEILRWHEERIALPAGCARADIESLLIARLEQLAAGAGGTDLLVRWTLIAAKDAPVWDGQSVERLVAALRDRYGRATPAVWTVAIELELAADQGTADSAEAGVLADLLAALRHLGQTPDEPLNLEDYLSHEQLSGAIGQLVATEEPTVRQRLLHDVAALGVQLLAPEETST